MNMVSVPKYTVNNCVVPKRPFKMLFYAYIHINITHTHIYIYIYIYCFSNSIVFRFGLVASTSSSRFSVSKAARIIKCESKPFVDLFSHDSRSVPNRGGLVKSCCNIRVAMQGPSGQSNCLAALQHPICFVQMSRCN
jgi:hypothetical protein